jgi:hypothetical protein
MSGKESQTALYETQKYEIYSLIIAFLLCHVMKSVCLAEL